MPQVSLAPPPLCSAYPSVLDRLLPSLPPTVGDTEVPPLFRKPFIVSGYRPVGQRWRCYVLSLFQVHNETINVWSHLLAAVCVAIRFMVFAGLSVDVSSLPLVLHHLSTVTYLSCSAAAHLLQPRSEPARRSLVLVDRVGVAIYQYGCAVALCLYSVDTAWTQSMLGQVSNHVLFFPLLVMMDSSVVLMTSFPGRYCWWVWPMCGSVVPVVYRLATCWWSNSAAPLHILQVGLLLKFVMLFFACCVSSVPKVVLFLLSALFSGPVPECFFPGHCDIVGQGHQIFHVLLALCTLVQQEALFRDFLWRRPGLVRQYGEERLLLVCTSVPCLALCCAATTFKKGRLQSERMEMQK
uniref:Progestin and adipoQ receptor family member 8 n=1 Tax=Takifugu rubripes TaxID=31033 RepID=A0A674NP43_TAKRU